MAQQNLPLLSFNRGLVSPKALARVDLDRTRLSAARMNNWLPKSQGAMRIRPGTKWLGSSYNDTGAQFIEFVAATDDTALPELTPEKMRVWIDDALLGRPPVDTTVTLGDTGWSNTSTGGARSTLSADQIPDMTGATTSGVTISASSERSGASAQAWRAADDDNSTMWIDTGAALGTLPSWWKVNFGSGNGKAIASYSIRASDNAALLPGSPARWQLICSNFDTGTYATDTGKWTVEDTQGSESGWAVSEQRTYRLPGGDTGTVEAKRYWRFTFLAAQSSVPLRIAEIEMFTGASALQVKPQSGTFVFNASSIGALARAQKQVIVSDTGTEHSLAIRVTRGPLTLRVGSTSGDDDYIRETRIGTGYHNLAFTPLGNFHITMQSDALVDRIVSSLTIGDSGTVEITTPWTASDLDNVRYDQSADVVYVDADGVRPRKIERRGTGRSWSVVEYAPNNGPFFPAASSSAKLSVSQRYGNTTLSSDKPFFKEEHTGALVRLFHSGQSGVWPLGALEAHTDAIEVTGISDTGEGDTGANERAITFAVSGTWAGTMRIERSFDGPDFGYHAASQNYMSGLNATDTGTFSRVIIDEDDNASVWYRARISSYTSGVAIVTATYKGGGVNGIGRITGYDSNTSVSLEVLSRFSDTGPTDSWQEGMWSDAQRFPSSVALHDGRLAHAAGANLAMSVSDDYENFDDETEGDAAPIVRTLGSGPVDNIYYLISLLRLIVGTSGSEMAVRSSSLDEPLTPSNNSVKGFSSRGSANLRAVKMDTTALFVARSQQRLYMVGFGGADAIGDYRTTELTMLVPDLLEAGVVSIGVQRHPDTRIHCVLADGTVGILTYDADQEVVCWHTWSTDGAVEKVAVLPGTGEDAVYYHVNRTIGATTKRFLERWASEAESEGDTGLSFLADCAKIYTDTGRATALTGFSHLAGETVVVWADDSGQATAGKDLSRDVNGVQTTYVVSGGGTVTVNEPVHHAVVGLPYTADYTSTKLAYAAQLGTALSQLKRNDKIGFVLYKTHNNGLFFGNDTGTLDPLPRMSDNGAQVDQDKIFETFDQAMMPFPGLWDTDSRIHLRAKAPRPCTVLAAVPSQTTNEQNARARGDGD